jgi:hypothetical protein
MRTPETIPHLTHMTVVNLIEHSIVQLIMQMIIDLLLRSAFNLHTIPLCLSSVEYPLDYLPARTADGTDPTSDPRSKCPTDGMHGYRVVHRVQGRFFLVPVI